MAADSVVAFIHIGAGTVALSAGAAALIFRKGSRGHRHAGTAFFVSMLVMSALGAYLAWIKPDMGTAIMGVLTFYVVTTAWMTVIRPERQSGRFEIAALLALGDLRVVVRRGIAGAQRLTRHLWRTCFALFIAAGSQFLGQPMVFPEPIRGTAVLYAPVLLVIGTMVFWLIRVRRRA